jgi:hypothetical protein
MKVNKWVAMLATVSVLAVAVPVAAQFGGLGALKKKLETVSKELDKTNSPPPKTQAPQKSRQENSQSGSASPVPTQAAELESGNAEPPLMIYARRKGQFGNEQIRLGTVASETEIYSRLMHKSTSIDWKQNEINRVKDSYTDYQLADFKKRLESCSPCSDNPGFEVLSDSANKTIKTWFRMRMDNTGLETDGNISIPPKIEYMPPQTASVIRKNVNAALSKIWATDKRRYAMINSMLQFDQNSWKDARCFERSVLKKETIDAAGNFGTAEVPNPRHKICFKNSFGGVDDFFYILVMKESDVLYSNLMERMWQNYSNR